MGAGEDQQNEKPRGKSISQAQFVSWKRQKVTFIYIYSCSNSFKLCYCYYYYYYFDYLSLANCLVNKTLLFNFGVEFGQWVVVKSSHFVYV